MSRTSEVLKAIVKGAKEGAKKGAATASTTRGGGKTTGALERIDAHLEAMLTPPTAGQAKAEAGTKSQRAYRVGQNKAGAAGVATGAAGTAGLFTILEIGGDLVSVPANKAANPEKLKEKDVELLEKKEASDFEKAFSKAFNNGEETFTWNGKKYAVELKAGDRTMKAKGGLMQDEIDKYKMLYSQMEKSLKQAKTEKEMQQIKNNFARTTENFDGGVVAEAWKQLDSETQSKKKMAEGGQMNSLFIPPEMKMEDEVPEDT